MSTPFNAPITGRAVPLIRDNVDTDIIMPKQFLKRIDRAGLADGVFHNLRFDAAGRPRPDFILNHPGYSGAVCLVSGENFGCGSSREHAVWGLVQLGIRVIIAQSFAGIFSDNAARNGLLLISLDRTTVSEVADAIARPATNMITLDLAVQKFLLSGGRTIEFDVDDVAKGMLLKGHDLIERTLQSGDVIAGFEASHRASAPWLITAPDD